ncbi:MAG: hypothetical protein JXR41_08915 [Bacteroidales bacterium]|nr:hypothetical protein [Bacteroidales bacterium]
MHSNHYIAFALVLLSVLSCSREKNEKPVYRDPSFDPVLFSDQLPGGLKNAADPYAKLVYGDILSMLDWSEFSGQLALPDSAEKQVSITSAESYLWNLNTGSLLLQIFLSFSKEGDDYVWQEEIRYGILGTYNEYITVRENESAKSGSLQYNMQWFCGLDQLTNPCAPSYRYYEWKITINGNLAYIVKFENQTVEPAMNIEYRLMLAPDGSGSVDAYSGTGRYYHAAWDTLGNGVYTLHNDEIPETHEWTIP